ncbi:MAG TPA: DUF1622 domain-containing protein [Jatrophihabitans sp.]|nr:DUF1622 domain-containing protein [Jatrophihabitans sp.]
MQERADGRDKVDYNDVMRNIGSSIDAIGVAVILVGIVLAAAGRAGRLVRHQGGAYREFRQQFGRALLLGLELLVAADLIRTVAAALTLTGVVILAIIVSIRTVLSFSLEVELTGRWPWQQGATGGLDE